MLQYFYNTREMENRLAGENIQQPTALGLTANVLSLAS